MRFWYAVFAMLAWIIFDIVIGIRVDSNTLVLSLAIIAAGAMAGGD